MINSWSREWVLVEEGLPFDGTHIVISCEYDGDIINFPSFYYNDIYAPFRWDLSYIITYWPEDEIDYKKIVVRSWRYIDE
jgi:hypothetical protein